MKYLGKEEVRGIEHKGRRTTTPFWRNILLIILMYTGESVFAQRGVAGQKGEGNWTKKKKGGKRGWGCGLVGERPHQGVMIESLKNTQCVTLRMAQTYSSGWTKNLNEKRGGGRIGRPIRRQEAEEGGGDGRKGKRTNCHYDEERGVGTSKKGKENRSRESVRLTVRGGGTKVLILGSLKW